MTGLLGMLALGYWALAAPLPSQYCDLKADISLHLVDRFGEPLRSESRERPGTERWISLNEIPKNLQTAILIAEDRRFRRHPGVDPLAIARAAKQNLQHRRVVSGASTITQQLLRTLDPDPNRVRTWSDKLAEASWAFRLERRFSKDEILEAYLNRVPLGGTIYGVEEASSTYFGKPCKALSLAESAMLAVLIRGPGLFDPWTEAGQAELKSFSAVLLDRMTAEGAIPSEAADRAKDESMNLATRLRDFRAPHFCDLIAPEIAGRRGVVATTLDLGLQQTVEGLVRTHLAVLAENLAGNAAVVVASVETGEILALVGSGDFYRDGDGQFNAAASVRQPGSTLKPFTYALLLEQTRTPGAILPDLPVFERPELRSFLPQNYDRRYHGPVTLRTALASSYNVPAVKALERVGVGSLLTLLQRCGISSLDREPDFYGLGLTLGDGSISLLELVEAYRVLAKLGLWSPLRGVQDPPGVQAMVVPETRVLEPEIAFSITEVLADRQARIPSFGTPNALELPFPCAVKTGTSKGYRDNWVLGYTPKYVLGVWIGNSDGSPMRQVSGITGAGPLFRDVMLLLGDGGSFSRPDGLVRELTCLLSGARAAQRCPRTAQEWWLLPRDSSTCSVCRWSEDGEPRFALDPLYQEWALERGLPLWEPNEQGPRTEENSRVADLQIVFPQDRETYLIDPDLKREHQRVRIRSVGGIPPYRWQVNETYLEHGEDGNSNSLWWTLKPGFHLIAIEDQEGSRAEVRLEVRGSSPDRK